MSHHIIEAKKVFFSYPDGTNALHDINFRITHGESVGIIGSNGAGKSTLMLLLNGSLFPTSGEIRIGDIPLARETVGQIRKAVGMIFQNPDDQLFMPTVEEDIAFGPANLCLPHQEIRKRIEEAMRQTGIEHLRNKPPYRLSAGEKKAASIAGVLAMTPDILVMDEPSSNLDPRARRRLIELLRSFSHTKIIATHDMELVKQLSDRIIILEKGKIVADGDAKSILSNVKLMTDYGFL